MVYIIKVSYYDEETCKPVRLVKIGFTEDDNWDNRFTHYKLHNPLCKVFRLISKATKEDEKCLQYKFKDYLYEGYGREWFYENEEMMKYLELVTLGELSSLPIPPTNNDKFVNHSVFKSWKVERLLDYVLRSEGKEDITVEDLKDVLRVVRFNTTTPESIFSEIQQSNHYLSIQNKTWEEIEDLLYKQSLTPEIIKFFEKYDQFTTYVDKIKFIVDYLIENPEHKEVIIGNLADSDKIKQQVVVLGPERIASLGYNLTQINKAMGITIFDKTTFMDEVYNSFIPGQRYTKKYIKGKLGEIYKAADFKGTPKANDLEKWFELRNTQISMNGKRENGFEILAKK